MIPSKAIRLNVGTLIAADVPTLAPAVPNKMALIMSAFVPSENIVLADITLADFDGSTPIAGTAGAQQVGLDPATGDQIITIKEPAGSWRWVTTGLTNLPQTIYGYALLDTTLATVLGTELLDAPLTLTIVGQEINLGTVKMTVVIEPLS